MPRMRTINAAYREIKQKDPDSAITLSGLRTLVITKALPSIRVGAKYLLDLEVVESYLQGDQDISMRDLQVKRIG